MPSGSLLQISSNHNVSGESIIARQNAFFHLNPDQTFWKAKYSRQTNYAKDQIQLDFTVPPKFNSQCSIIVPRLGDLLSNIWLQVTLTKSPTVYPSMKGLYFPVEALIKDVTLSIGGLMIDRHTSDYFRIHHETMDPLSKKYHYNRVSNFDCGTITTDNAFTETLYFPLIFFFSKLPGLALPLISLYYSEVKLTFTLNDAETVGVMEDFFDMAVFADYVYLDTEERKKFLDRNHEYLIEQTQSYTKLLEGSELPSTTGQSVVTANLPFRNPTKCLFWVLKDISPTSTNMTYHGRYVGDGESSGGDTYLCLQPSGFSDSQLGLVDYISEKLAPIYSVRLLVNGTDRFSKRRGTYFNKGEPYISDFQGSPMPGIYYYSFCLNPGEQQPSGSMNFSAMDDVKLILTLKKSVGGPLSSSNFTFTNAETNALNITKLQELKVFALSYNILRISQGFASLDW